MIYTTDEVHEYTLKKERGKPDATVFLLKELSCGVTNRIQDEATERGKDGKWRVKLGTAAGIQLSSCLIGWRGMKNKKGEEIPFGIEKIATLPPAVQTELNSEIDRISTPSEEEIKN